MLTKKRSAEDGPTEDKIQKDENLVFCDNCKSVDRVKKLKCGHHMCAPCFMKRIVDTVDITNGNCLVSPCCVCKKTVKVIEPLGWLFGSHFNKEENIILFKTFKPLVDWYIKNKPELRYRYCSTLDCSGFYISDIIYNKCLLCEKTICQCYENSLNVPHNCFLNLPQNINVCPQCFVPISKDCAMPITMTCTRCKYSWFWCCDNYIHKSHGGIYTNNVMIKKVLDHYFKGKKEDAIDKDIKIRIMEQLRILISNDTQWSACEADIDVLNYDEVFDLIVVLNNTKIEDRFFTIRQHTVRKKCFGEVKLPTDASMITQVEMSNKNWSSLNNITGKPSVSPSK